MTQLELARQIERIRGLLISAQCAGNMRLEKQYIMALFHLNKTLVETILKQDCFQNVA